MVNQKPISAKLDYEVLHILDQECLESGMTRNRLINEAIRTYVAIQDSRRRYEMFGNESVFKHHCKALNLPKSIYL